MCVAIAVPKGVTSPSLEILKKCEEANPHGGGFSWIEDGQVRWVKGEKISAEQIYEWTQILGGKGPFLIHFRITSVGTTCDELCHPFGVSRSASIETNGRAKMVLMHNGTWDQWKAMMLHKFRDAKFPDGPWSDTRAMAYLAYRFGSPILEFIDEKVLTMDSDGVIRRYGSNWTTKDGVMYSNTGWEYRYTRDTYRGNGYQHTAPTSTAITQAKPVVNEERPAVTSPVPMAGSRLFRADELVPANKVTH